MMSEQVRVCMAKLENLRLIPEVYTGKRENVPPPHTHHTHTCK